MSIDVSVVIPFCDEGANVIFTTQAIIEELHGWCNYEVILVDNMSHDHLEIKAGGREYTGYSRNYWENERTGRRLNTWFVRKGLVKYFQYDEKQGHWNAKNFGIAKSSGKYVFFLDAHCVMKRDSLRHMVAFLDETEGKVLGIRDGFPYRVGAVHAYINYILDSRCLEYRPQRKTFGYQFCTHQSEEYFVNSREGVPRRALRFPTVPYQVCVMSTCAMMCRRSVLDQLGPWSPELGIYGGGESYINWKQSICGQGHWIVPQAWCWHFADKRGYSWNWTDFTRNSMIAAYVVGGEEFLQEQVDLRLKKSSPEVLESLAQDVREKCGPDRRNVENRQMVSFDRYMKYWEEHPGTWK